MALNFYVTGPFLSSQYQRNNAGATGTQLQRNTRELLVQNIDATRIVLLYITDRDQGVLDLNTIPSQCTIIPPRSTLRLELGSERTRPTTGWIYYNYTSGAGNQPVNVCQLLGNY